MNKLSYDNRCKCKQESTAAKIKPHKRRRKKEGKPFAYPDFQEIRSQTFRIVYKSELSSTALIMLNTFQEKYFYHVIDDIIYASVLTQMEQERLLSLLCSPIFSLQNDFSIDFFNVWIHELYIDENLKKNRFVQSKFKDSFQITIKVFYKVKTLKAVSKLLW